MKKDKIKKIDVAKKISKKTGFYLEYSKKITDDLINIILENIKSGYLNLKNIGSFNLIKKKERLGRNPNTKEEYIIKARKSVRFISSKKIAKKI